jgi:hypothetical protein
MFQIFYRNILLLPTALVTKTYLQNGTNPTLETTFSGNLNPPY